MTTPESSVTPESNREAPAPAAARASAAPPARPGIPGFLVVVGMLLAGVTATAAIFIYWDFHTRPFRPLTEAIGRELRHSLPKVEGGRHKGSPAMLRIAIRVPFAPEPDSADTRAVVNQVVRLAREHADLSAFEEIRLHLFQLAPERVAQQASFEYPVADIMQELPFPDAPDVWVPQQ